MKRLVSLSLVLVLTLISYSGAYASVMSDKYDEALELFMQKQYRDAAKILDEISIYNDASQLSIYCKSVAEGTDGNYAVAYKMLDVLGEYKDAKTWSIYFKACEAQEKGDTLLAYELFDSIPLFLNSAERIQQVKTGQNSIFKKEYAAVNITEGLIVVKKDDKYGYADLNGNIVLEPKWSIANGFVDGAAIVATDSNRYYVIDYKGRNIIGSYWTTIYRKGNYYVVGQYDFSSKKIKEGIIEKDGSVIFETKYEDVKVLNSKLFAIKKNDKYCVYNLQSKQVFNGQYDDIDVIKDHLFRIKNNGKYGFINDAGIVKCDPVYDSVASGESAGLLVVTANKKSGYINTDGDVVIKLKFDTARSFNGMIAIVQYDGKWGCIDTNGNTVIPFEFEELYSFAEGFALSKKNGKYGYIDENGNAVIDFIWDSASSFSEGKAFVMADETCYCIDAEGNRLFDVPIEGAYCGLFKDGIAKIYLEDPSDKSSFANRKYGLINDLGEIIIPPEYDYISQWSEHLYKVSRYSDNKEGMVGTDGKWFLDVKYDSISSLTDDGYALVTDEYTWFIIDREGNIVF